jgi:FkbM family methyltransferase
LQKTTITTYKSRDSLIFLYPILNRINHFIASRNVKKHPQLGIFAFDHIGLTINTLGRYEDKELNILGLLLTSLLGHSPNGVALDVGANIGNHSIFLTKFFKDIYAYEPNPTTFMMLELNCQLLKRSVNLERIHCRNYALGDMDGYTEMELNRKNMGSARLIPGTYNPIARKDESSPTVHVKKLDDIFELGDKDIRLIKIDVEGHELNVLRGASRILNRQKPIVIFEQQQHSDEAKSPAPSVVFLIENGYDILAVEENFNFGHGFIPKVFQKIFQSVFYQELSLVRMNDPGNRFQQMLIAVPKFN